MVRQLLQRLVLAAAPALLSALLLGVLFPGPASAIPAFARRIGRDCSYCHIQIPKLNETGRTFRHNGLRFEDEGEWGKARDLKLLPVSVEIEVEGSYDDVTASGVSTGESDLVIEEVELMAGGAFGKSGRLSAYGSASVGQTSTGYTTALHNAYVQVNDLVGPTGAGRLNLRAGQQAMGLLFLADDRKVIANRYFAEKSLNLLTMDQRGIELNGMVMTPDEESNAPTHRYFAGVAREDAASGHKLNGFYAKYIVTFRETFSVGAIYRGGKESNGAADASFNRYGAAAEAEVSDNLVVTAGYFVSDKSGTPVKRNYLIEALYMPTPRLTLGGRYDVLEEDGKKDARSHSLMVRYNILTSAFAQLEYRGLVDDDHAAGANEDESRVRLFLTALF